MEEIKIKIIKRQKNKKLQKRLGLTVLTPELLEPKPTLPNKWSVSAFIREKKLQISRELQRRNHRAKKLGIPVENCPLPDPIWRRYQHGSIRIKDFDLNGCDNDEIIFALAEEAVEQAESAEISPDSGIPIDSEITLPRSFLLDSIHHAASIHCLHLQIKANKPSNRQECPSPVERSRSLEGFSERYKSTLKTLVKRTKRSWIESDGNGNKRVKKKFNTLDVDTAADIDTDMSKSESENEIELFDFDDGDVTDLESESSEFINNNTIRSSSSDTIDNSESAANTIDSKASKQNTSPSIDININFDAILSRLLDTPEALNPVLAYQNYTNSDEYGADGLWTFDSSGLLAFGILAEEFIGRMIDAHLENLT